MPEEGLGSGKKGDQPLNDLGKAFDVAVEKEKKKKETEKVQPKKETVKINTPPKPQTEVQPEREKSEAVTELERVITHAEGVIAEEQEIEKRIFKLLEPTDKNKGPMTPKEVNLRADLEETQDKIRSAMKDLDRAREDLAKLKGEKPTKEVSNPVDTGGKALSEAIETQTIVSEKETPIKEKLDIENIIGNHLHNLKVIIKPENRNGYVDTIMRAAAELMKEEPEYYGALQRALIEHGYLTTITPGTAPTRQEPEKATEKLADTVEPVTEQLTDPEKEKRELAELEFAIDLSEKTLAENKKRLSEIENGQTKIDDFLILKETLIKYYRKGINLLENNPIQYWTEEKDATKRNLELIARYNPKALDEEKPKYEKKISELEKIVRTLQKAVDDKML